MNDRSTVNTIRLLWPGSLAVVLLVAVSGCDASMEPVADAGDAVSDVSADASADVLADVVTSPQWTERAACLSEDDEWVARPTTANRLLNCAGRCADAPVVRECVMECAQNALGLGVPCASCFADEAACVAETCGSTCESLTDLRRDGCAACAAAKCGPEAVACRGEVFDDAPLPPPPAVSCADLGGLDDPDGVFEAFRETCWNACRWDTRADQCVASCMGEVIEEPQCVDCFERFVRCEDACSTCGLDPLGAGCRACAAPCFEVLGACTDVDITAYETPDVPFGALQFINGSTSVSRASVVVLPDGTPLVRRLPTAEFAAYSFVGVGTYTLALTEGTIGADTVVVAELDVPVGQEELLTLVSYDTEVGTSALLALQTGPADAVQVRILNLSTQWPTVDIASTEFEVEPATLGVPTTPTRVTDTLFDVRVDLDRDGVDDVWIPTVGYPSQRQIVFVIVDDVEEPAGVSAIVVSGHDPLRGTSLVPL